MILAITTSDRRKAEATWRELGGRILPKPGTGEVSYVHPAFLKPLRINNRRKDTPAILLSRINQLRRKQPSA